MSYGKGGQAARRSNTGRSGGPAVRRSATAFILAALFALFGVTRLSAQEIKSIKPGMTEAQVKAAWGEPMTARKSGDMTYLYYKNDCLKSCGTYDVVFLEKGQVVDAVVRDSHRAYDGIASSPRDRKPEATIH